MHYVPISQTERRISKLKHKNKQKTMFIIVGALLVCLIAMLVLIVLDVNNYVKINSIFQIWQPQNTVAMVQTQRDLISSKHKQIDEELIHLKSIFQEKAYKEATNLKLPIIDKNEYQYFTLSNGLKVLVIQDPEAKIAQAALCVNVGSWTEPDEYPGLAHFLEHMLFQGSKSYPQEGYFQKLVAEGGGSTNAYTRGEETNYYMKINNERVVEALQVFAHFFIDPLLDSSMVEREVNAVNSEYEIAVSGDLWKISHLFQILSNKPIGRFTIGSLKTLKDPMKELVKFHSQFYSANIMSLVVKSNYPDMAKWIREQSDFSQIPNLNLKKRSKLHLPLKKTGLMVKYKTNGDKNQLILAYQLDSPRTAKKSKTLPMIASLIKSKHKEGLLDYLVRQKMALNVDAGTFLEGNGDFTFFLIEIELIEGVDELKVAETVTGYFNNMLDQFFQEVDKNEINYTPYLEEIWQQYKQLQLSQYNYLDNNHYPTVQQIAHNLNYFDYTDAMSIEFLYEEFQPESIYNYLTEMLNPSNIVIFHGSPKFTNLKQSSELYRLEYEIMTLSREQIKKLSSAVTTKVVLFDWVKSKQLPLLLPKINTFIPKDFSIKSLCREQTSFIQAPLVFKSKEDCIQHEKEYEAINHYPLMIKRTVETKAWWKLQRQFQVPQIFTGVMFNTPKSINSLKDKLLIQVFNTLVTDNLNQEIQEAIDAGYQFQFTPSIKGVSLELYGWSDNYQSFFEKVLQSINNLKYDSFYQVKQKLMIYYNNIYQDKLFRVAMSEYLNQVVQAQYYTSQLFQDELATLDLESLQEFHSNYFSNFRVSSFVSGNILRSEVEDLLHTIRKVFHKSSSHTSEEPHVFNIRDFTNKKVVVPLTHKGGDNNDVNGATINYYQIGHRNKKNFAIMNLIQQFFHNHAFQYLRTERQLGYVALMRFIPIGCIDGAAIIVQGTAQMPYVVNQHIEDFLKQFHNVLLSLADDQLDNIKNGAKSALQEKDKSLYDESAYIWSQIRGNNLQLEEKEIAIAMIDEIMQKDIVDFYEKYFIKQQNKLSLQIYGKGLIEQFNQVKDNLLEKEEIIELKTLNEFKCAYTLNNL
ncbi:unnamed protein product (macronuclear) [Paramecium tetraurelia]|uniref:Chromosome undetermined scaffold_1, whole genome shotgun sequence n=1 Tax=Paramecium tetraurelia TaxID=5888 RepID=Q6BFR8_PARTE|nr:Insulin degrading enzyme-like zinc peptidase [Paramecium tetraurelia strain d4-2]XP_001423158.1 uncharacterized protein GSPATT00000195001 [Paramecium tetraurelia]CAH03502.1 Insulin degrading enzyme-like zinc peptidase, putative [Paramecium tetraurelia]CAK55760.1 unnamed protein product [Paramecium tetraurelia]|eukprot:XP_001423158.1 hypothetical protein (macronuclear) [Paramecium tetraurelia strain d4-2]